MVPRGLSPAMLLTKRHELEVALERRQRRALELQEKHDRLTFGVQRSGSGDPAVSSTAKASGNDEALDIVGWRSRVGAQLLELGQARQRVEALKAREQQLEIDFRHRLHQDGGGLIALCFEARELAQAVSVVPRGATPLPLAATSVPAPVFVAPLPSTSPLAAASAAIPKTAPSVLPPLQRLPPSSPLASAAAGGSSGSYFFQPGEGQAIVPRVALERPLSQQPRVILEPRPLASADDPGAALADPDPSRRGSAHVFYPPQVLQVPSRPQSRATTPRQPGRVLMPMPATTALRVNARSSTPPRLLDPRDLTPSANRALLQQAPRDLTPSSSRVMLTSRELTPRPQGSRELTPPPSQRGSRELTPPHALLQGYAAMPQVIRESASMPAFAMSGLRPALGPSTAWAMPLGVQAR